MWLAWDEHRVFSAAEGGVLEKPKALRHMLFQSRQTTALYPGDNTESRCQESWQELGMVALVFNPSKSKQISVSLRSAWST